MELFSATELKKRVGKNKCSRVSQRSRDTFFFGPYFNTKDTMHAGLVLAILVVVALWVAVIAAATASVSEAGGDAVVLERPNSPLT